ncbi:NAB transcription cofactor mab-10-like isoform X1 [Ruditapes philippinarum]|uniref:NAB transcription cofactor mab-10-like isoform X1 n=1 Tax=Ruditapes philippinarum TaxID=129788 RepID=UPI00295C1E51|nr:NAB transcription cofactor mab-10-like isoform X1 [Ruditapes philippinarum]XP_060558695.1 NAB transcription cofactor mab-10-like isoform X1 [Ruditapes philippinarum]
MTSTQPTNASEWQLYRVLQRANLLQYYDTFVAQGGDDVQQLCEAGEEEFLEIMALVGMASKPLHVRRLQKALQEWVANPAAFQGTGNTSTSSVVREPPTHVYSLPSTSTEGTQSPSLNWNIQTTPQKSVSPVSMIPSSRPVDLHTDLLQGQMKKQGVSPIQAAPYLGEDQISEIANCAAKLVKNLPVFEAKPLNTKKEINKQIYDIIALPIDFSKERLELMRKYAAIYRRFDSERIYSKPMSMHEVCVNEASAQLCFHMPTLLTRREDLFPLARQVVKDSGYQYSKGHSRLEQKATDLNPENPSKRQKLEALISDSKGDQSLEKAKRDERLQQISQELAMISEKQEQIVTDLETAKESQDMDKVDTLQSQLEQITNKHLQLLTEQSDLLRKQSFEVYIDFDASSDRDDSNLGASGSSSPAQTDRTESTQQHLTLKSMLTTGLMPKSSFNQLTSAGGPSKNTLFDEGLRFAQQYGLGDFAQELKTLQGSPEESEGQSDLISSLFSSGLLRANKNGATNGDRVSPKPSEEASNGEKSPAKESPKSIKEEVDNVNGV